MKKKIFWLSVAAMIVVLVTVLSFVFVRMTTPFDKERDLPVLYRKVADYLTENWLIEDGLIQQTEGEVALFDFYKLDLSEEQREEILQYLEKKYPPVNFNEPVQMTSGGYIVGAYPIFELRNLYWKEEKDRYYINVRCSSYSKNLYTHFKLSYVFERGRWKFLGESAVTDEDFDWYDQHVKE